MVTLAEVQVQSADFDLGAEVAALRAGDGGAGAVVAFVGTVRDRDGSSGAAGAGNAAGQSPGSITALELEHYPGMTENAIQLMVAEARRRFADLRKVRIVHRVGVLQPLDQIVLVAVSAAHRGTAFQACEFLMDYLKTQAPFWKKENTPDGAHWVDARAADDAALARWGIVAVNA